MISGDFKHFYWIGHDVIFGSRSRSALEYWFSNSFTAFCFLWLFWYWWPAGRVCISRGFKGPRETPRSKPNIFTGLLFTRVGREMQASDWGKPQVEDKLVFMITCTVLWRLESSVVVEFPFKSICLGQLCLRNAFQAMVILTGTFSERWNFPGIWTQQRDF